MTDNTETTRLPDPGPIVSACRSVARSRAHDIDCRLAPAKEGWWVTMATRPAQRDAVTVLHELGYAAQADTGPTRPKDLWPVLVTGWDQPALQERVDRAELRIRNLERDHDLTAATTLEQYRAGRDEGAGKQAAKDRATTAARTAMTHRAGGPQIEGFGVSAVDLANAPGPVRELLVRADAADRTISDLTDTHMRTSQAAIDLYEEYVAVHGHRPDQAAGRTLTDISEGIRATHELALADAADNPAAAPGGTSPGSWHTHHWQDNIPATREEQHSGDAVEPLVDLIDRFEIDMMHAPTRRGHDDLREEIADYARTTGNERCTAMVELRTRDWAEDGAPTLLDSWRRNVEEGVLQWALREKPDAAGDFLRSQDTHGEPLEPEHRNAIWCSMADSYCANTHAPLPHLGQRQLTAMTTARDWADALSPIEPALADPRDIPALSAYLERGHAAGYPVLDDVRHATADARPLGERPGRALMLRLSNVWDEQRIDNHPDAQAVAQRLDDPEVSLPPGYSIAECGIPGVPPRYQVLQGTSYDEQFIAMRENREDATRLAYFRHSRAMAERSAAAKLSPQPPAPRL